MKIQCLALDTCNISFTKNVTVLYSYMYLKTYAKFTFCIKSQGHVSDESFLYYCMHLARKISSYGV